ACPPHKMVSRHWLIRSSWPTMTLASSVRPCVSTWDTVCMSGGLLLFQGNEFQVVRAMGQLLRQRERPFFRELRAAQGIFNLRKELVQRVVLIAQAAFERARQLRRGSVRVEAELARGQHAEPGIRNGQGGVSGMRAMIQPSQRVHKLQRREPRRLRQRM